MHNELTLKSTIDLLILAALWGASFMFMRIGVPEFGAFLFAALRTTTAAIFLYFCLQHQKQLHTLKGRWLQISIAGLFNTAIPFALYSYATLTLSAGNASVLNATTPMFGALVAFIWLKDKLHITAIIGLIIGFIGVYILVTSNTSITGNDSQFVVIDEILPSLAALTAALCYAIAANYTKKYLIDIKPLALAAGSQISATCFLLPISLCFLPQQLPSSQAIASVIIIGIACTGIAYILYFRLITMLGPAKAMSVTYLIPAFGLMWGAIFLNEVITSNMIFGALVILFGVALTTGVFKRLSIRIV